MAAGDLVDRFGRDGARWYVRWMRARGVAALSVGIPGLVLSAQIVIQSGVIVRVCLWVMVIGGGTAWLVSVALGIQMSRTVASRYGIRGSAVMSMPTGDAATFDAWVQRHS